MLQSVSLPTGLQFFPSIEFLSQYLCFAHQWARDSIPKKRAVSTSQIANILGGLRLHLRGQRCHSHGSAGQKPHSIELVGRLEHAEADEKEMELPVTLSVYVYRYEGVSLLRTM